MPIIGLDNLEKTQAEDIVRRGAPNQFLLLKGGDSAKIRFITEGSEIITLNYHMVPRRTRGGAVIPDLVYCGWDDGKDCALCGDVSGPPRSRKLNAYVWVYRTTKANGDVVEVNAPKVLRTGPGNSGYITTLLTTYLRKYSTLKDRDYEWRRTGTQMENTVYNLIPEDPTPFPVEIMKGIGSLPPLMDISTNTVFLPGSSQPSRSVTTGVVPPLRQPQSSSAPGKSLLQKLREKQVPAEEVEEIGEEL